MNEFERQIRAAISAARNGAKHAEQSLTTPMWQAKSTVASLGGIVPRSGSSSTSQAENYKEGLADQAASRQQHGAHECATGHFVSATAKCE